MEEVKETQATISSQEAQAILMKEQQDRITACSQELNSLLDKYSCTLDVAMILRQGSIIPNISIVPRPSQPQQ